MKSSFDITAFNWNTLTRQALSNSLSTIRSRVVNQPLTVDQLHRIISTRIREIVPIRVVKKIDKSVITGMVYIGGMYYSDYDEDLKKSIELIFVYKTTNAIISLKAARFTHLCNLFADTVLHEVIHMNQYRKRNHTMSYDYSSTVLTTKKRIEQCYLGNIDEIGAYSFNIACELLQKFKNSSDDVIRHIKDTQRIKYKSSSWKMYIKAFDYDHTHPVIQELKIKIILNLPAAAAGKPYKKSKWINIR